MDSLFLTKELVEECVDILRPTIETLIAKDPKRMLVYLLVLQPNIIDSVGGRDNLDVLWEGAVGEQDRNKWPVGRNYPLYVRKKAKISLIHKRASHLVLRDACHLISPEDSKCGGGEYRDGIVTAGSALEWYDNYAVASMLASLLHA